jgi:hypothetical protein
MQLLNKNLRLFLNTEWNISIVSVKSLLGNK